MAAKIVKGFQISVASLCLMSYGWYLGQLHQSGYDVAGILLFITGSAGLLLAFIFHAITKKNSWHNKWFANIVTGVASCGIVFALIAVYAHIHG